MLPDRAPELFTGFSPWEGPSPQEAQKALAPTMPLFQDPRGAIKAKRWQKPRGAGAVPDRTFPNSTYFDTRLLRCRDPKPAITSWQTPGGATRTGPHAPQTGDHHTRMVNPSQWKSPLGSLRQVMMVGESPSRARGSVRAAVGQCPMAPWSRNSLKKDSLIRWLTAGLGCPSQRARSGQLSGGLVPTVWE